MKYLVVGLTFAAIALAQHPKVSDCFKVHELLRADEEHYWATWTNACPYTIDSVYVMVGFLDRSARDVAQGVWALHFIAPGAHRTMRFSAPGKLADFASVHQRKITADIYEAFGREAPPAAPVLSPMEMTAVSAFKEAVANDGRPRVIPVSTVITDAGEGAYRSLAPAENIVRSAILKEALASTSITHAAPAARTDFVVGDPGEGAFRTDFPDAWRAVLSPQESAVSPAPRPSFVRFVSEEKPLFR
jgi:hypothetical protein